MPPPQSKIRTFFSPASLPRRSRPYARAAAVGSLIMRSTFSPAIAPASFVAWRWESLKYAGTVTTASRTVPPRNASAVAFIFWRTAALISSGRNWCFSPFHSTSIFGLPPTSTTAKGQSFFSVWTTWSSYLRPIRRFASNTVLEGLDEAWDLAASPMRRSSGVNAT